ncbi:hypothetical protein V5O48_017724 [Marasmius crinis-equi]|uniref:Uncharacterized protein n=1 Tax=Marasmius crinis-equi TaxID=585013 RepID=A0ABR3EN77_9AGAR
MGHSSRNRYTRAVKDRNLQSEAHNGLTSNIPKALVEEWEGMCLAWEQSPWPKTDVFNPYKIVEEYQSQADCLWELVLDDERRMKSDGMEYPSVSPSAFIVLLLELQQSQQKLKDQLKAQKREPTNVQDRMVTEQQNAMRRTMQSLDNLRNVYMPGLERYLKEAKLPDLNPELHPEDVTLYLPSDLPRECRGRLCVPGLVDIETRLQLARCLDSLHGLCHTLWVNVQGQEVINRVAFHARTFAETYREVQTAYKNLVGGGHWEQKLQPLRDSDVQSLWDPALVQVRPGRRGTNEEDEPSANPTPPSERDGFDLIPPDRTEWAHCTKHGTGETRKMVSWIWTSGGGLDLEDGANENSNEVLCSEWCKSRARVMRAEEEVLLVKEEMRWMLEYLSWSASEWEQIPVAETDSNSTLRKGMEAYQMELVVELQEEDEECHNFVRESCVLDGEEDDEAGIEGLEDHAAASEDEEELGEDRDVPQALESNKEG